MIKTALITLGCTKNQVDSEHILGGLEGGPLDVIEDPMEAELIIINTCGFIDQAREESVEVILDAAGLKETGACRALVVCGCAAQRYGEELGGEMPEIDAIIGFDRYHELEEICLSLFNGETGGVRHHEDTRAKRRLLNPSHYAYLKISEGCDNRCAYCAIPDIRGPHRSRPMEELMNEAEMLARQGVVEINLIAQDTTRYGLDIYGRQRLHLLLRELGGIDGLRWIRLLYTHPAHWYPELVRELAENDRVVKYVDLPLQHVSDGLLTAMNRRVDRAGIERLVRELRDGVPGLTLRTTFIVGLPGEGDDEFGELLKFVERMRFERLGAFTYSPEEGTPASSLPGRVDDGVKQSRLDELMSLQRDISWDLNDGMVGETVEVLIEGPGEEGHPLCGRTAAQAPEVDGQVLLAQGDAEPGEFVRVRITDAAAYDLFGDII